MHVKQDLQEPWLALLGNNVSGYCNSIVQLRSSTSGHSHESTYFPSINKFVLHVYLYNNLELQPFQFYTNLPYMIMLRTVNQTQIIHSYMIPLRGVNLTPIYLYMIPFRRVNQTQVYLYMIPFKKVNQTQIYLYMVLFRRVNQIPIYLYKILLRRVNQTQICLYMIPLRRVNQTQIYLYMVPFS